MDWDKLRIFHAVADAGSLTHAGETLHLSQSAVSRQIRALEEEVVRVSCLLPQPRYQTQEVRVPFERIGGDWGLLMPGRRGVRGPSRVLWPP